MKYKELKLSKQITFPLYVLSRRTIQTFTTYLSPLGLTYSQYLVLASLWEHEQMTVKELGEKLFLDSGTLSPLLKTLEKKGLISRTKSDADERCLIIRCTEEGAAIEEAVKDLPAEMRKHTKETYGDHFTAEDSAQLHKLLNKLLEIHE